MRVCSCLRSKARSLFQIVRFACLSVILSSMSLSSFGENKTEKTDAFCLEVILTGTKGGPNVYRGLAGPGTLVTFGSVQNHCRDLLLQFDVGRGTSIRLAQLDVMAGDINALFLTHAHSDHVQGLADFMQLRWHYYSNYPAIDVVSTQDVKAPAGHITSSRELGEHIADAFIASGEIAQRHSERTQTIAEGPAALINAMLFDSPAEPLLVWKKGEVEVSALATNHTVDHVSYRVDTPVGSVVIGGDASNNVRVPPRKHSTSDQVEALAKGADVLVHSSTHPNMGPEAGGGMPPPIFYRQSTVKDLGAMAERAGVRIYMLTHLTPSLGEVPGDEGWAIPGAPLGKKEFEAAARDGGFTGTVIVGTDLAGVRLPYGTLTSYTTD